VPAVHLAAVSLLTVRANPAVPVRRRAACLERAVRRERRAAVHPAVLYPASGSVRPEARRARALPQPAVLPGVPAGRRPVPVGSAARALRRRAAVSERDAPVQPRAAAAVVSDVPARPQVAASALDARAQRPEAAWDVREQPRAAAEEEEQAVPERLRAAEPAVSGAREPRQAAALVVSDGQAPRPGALPADAAVRLPAAPAVPAPRPVHPAPVARVASAVRPDRFLPLAAPVRRLAARIARAMRRRRAATPSVQSWRAARDEALS
jgi:hypothetical protein